MMDPNRSISPGSLILVTGANGYIASHVVNILLGEGYRVRGTVRTAKPWLDRYFEQIHGEGRFESVVVPQLEYPEAWSDISEDVSGIVHLASDLSLQPDPHAIIPRVIKMTINALEVAQSRESVKSVVLTSSSAAAFVSQANVQGIVVDEKTWNTAAVKAAWDPSTPAIELGFQTYAASKALGEQEAWRWAKEHKPHFKFNVIVPNTNYGKILCSEQPGSTMTWTAKLLEGDDTVVVGYPPQWFVNVEDCARLHVAALLDPKVKSERIFAFAAPFNWTDILRILRKLRPDNQLLREPPLNEGRDLSELVRAPAAEDLLRSFFGCPGWVSLEQSLADGIDGRF